MYHRPQVAHRSSRKAILFILFLFIFIPIFLYIIVLIPGLASHVILLLVLALILVIVISFICFIKPHRQQMNPLVVPSPESNVSINENGQHPQICEYCGVKIEANARFCSRCGNRKK